MDRVVHSDKIEARGGGDSIGVPAEEEDGDMVVPVEELKSGQGRERERGANSIGRVRSSERGVDMLEGGEGGKGAPPGHDSNLMGDMLLRTL